MLPHEETCTQVSLGHDPAVTAYVVLLREALEHLISAVEMERGAPSGLKLLMSCTPELNEARRVLSQETGRLEQQVRANEAEIITCGYLLADYVHSQLYGVSRSQSGFIPTIAEVQETLRELERLTQVSWALDALSTERSPHESHSELSHT